MSRYDAIVVGAGLAGLATAIRLANKNKQILIIEKETEPQYKVCGDFLSGECRSLLEEIGLDVDSLQAEKIQRVSFFSQKTELESRLPFTGLGVSRVRLEKTLISLAESLGVHFQFGEKAHDFSAKSDRQFTVRTKENQFSAPVLFWATGKYDVPKVQKRIGSESASIGFKNILQLPAELSNSLSGKIELHLYAGGYLGLSKVAPDVVNCSCVIDKQIYKELGSWNKLLKYQAKKNPRLQTVFAEAEWLWEKPMSVANIPYGFKYETRKKTEQVFMLGDQFSVIPSLTGDGMAIALLSAKMAVESYFAHDDLVEAVQNYQSKMKAKVAIPMLLGDGFHRIFRSPLLSRVTMGVLRPFPGIVEKFVEKTRSHHVYQA